MLQLNSAAGYRAVFNLTATACALLCIGLVTRCSTYDNPFSDTGNARVIVLAERSELADGDTVPMFTVFDLILGVLVPEMVDSFAVQADSSYRCRDTVIRSPGTTDYVFRVAFADTGVKTILLTTFRTGGDRSTERVSLRVTNPLGQNDVQGDIGQELRFSTTPVGDTVWYHWAYGDGVRIPLDTFSSKVWEVNHRLSATGVFPGNVWVSRDSLSRNYVSPAVSFQITLDDNAAPDITFLNDVHGDTIIAPDSSLVLLALISDGGGISQVFIDNVQVPVQSSSRYRFVLNGLHTSAVPSKAVSVRAVDGSGNAHSLVVYVVYDPQAESQTTRISLIGIDSTGLDSLYLRGTVREYELSDLRLTLRVNDVPQGDTSSVAMATEVQDFGMWVKLVPGSNDVRVSALGIQGEIRADTSVTIIYAQGFADTKGPVIAKVTADEIDILEGRVEYTTDSSAAVTVQAYDYGSGVRAVMLNGRLMTPSGDGISYAALLGGLLYNVPVPVEVIAEDYAGNQSRFATLIVRNRAPSLPAGWLWPERLFAGTSYQIEFDVHDEESAVVVHVDGALAGMELRKLPGFNRWSIVWTPDEQHVGERAVSIVMSDAVQSTVSPWFFRVMRDSSTLVRFATQPSEIVGTAVALRDTVRASLRVDTGRGELPLRLSAWIHGANGSLLDSVYSTRTVPFMWVPSEADTGLKQLRFRVVDANGDYDEFTRDIYVVRPNVYPCTLRYTLPANIDTTAFGELDVRSAAGPIVIPFTIVDTDDKRSERYTRVIDIAGSRSVDTLDSAATFTVTLGTASSRPHDTLAVTVTDLTGSVSTVRIPILYAYPKPRILQTWQWPRRFIAGQTVSVPFDITAPWHPVSVTASGAPDGLAFTSTQTDNSFTLDYAALVSDSGTYNVVVRIADKYQDTTVLWTFTVLADSSRIVSFAAGSAALAAYAEIGEPITCTLAVRAGSGEPPLRYRIWRDGVSVPFVDTTVDGRQQTVVSWTPTAADSGNRSLRISVADSIGDADTLFRALEVVPSNRWPCSLMRSFGLSADTTANGALDMQFATGPDTIRFVINDLDHPQTERYEVFVTRGNVTTADEIGYSRLFEIVVDPSTALWGYDTITVVVLDASGTSDMQTVRIWYGIRLPSSASGSLLELRVKSEPAFLQLRVQNDTPFVNVWQGIPAPFAFGGNTVGGAPPYYRPSPSPASLKFRVAEKSNLVATMSRNMWPWIDSAFTVFIVARADALVAGVNYTLLSSCDSQTLDGFVSMGVTDGYAGIFGAGSTSRSTIPVVAGAWYVYAFRSSLGRQGSNIGAEVWVNGQSSGSTVSISQTFIGYHTMVGAALRDVPRNPWNGDIAEIVMYRGALHDYDRRQIEAVLASGYGIALD